MWKAKKQKAYIISFQKGGNAISLDEEKMRSRLAQERET
jgi:hypothetical protein